LSSATGGALIRKRVLQVSLTGPPYRIVLAGLDWTVDVEKGTASIVHGVPRSGLDYHTCTWFFMDESIFPPESLGERWVGLWE